jgi:hypothetical protein
VGADGVPGADENEFTRGGFGRGEYAAFTTEEDGSGDQVSISVGNATGQTEGLIQLVLYK